jgi:hypothetical protein
MNRNGLTLTTLAWVASFALLIPYQIGPPKAASLAALLVLLFLPRSLNFPWIYAVLGYSYYIGAAIVLILSGLVVRSTDRRARAMAIVLAVDLILIVSSWYAGLHWADPEW